MTGSRAPDAPGGEPRRQRAELITATGWRLVGPAAELVSDLAAAGVDRPERDEDIVFAAHFQLRPRMGANVADQALSVLNAALATVRAGRTRLDRRTDVTEVSGRYDAVQWRVAEADDRWVGELVWRHPHPAVRGVACTTHAVLADLRPATPTLTVRVAVPGGVRAVYGPVGAGQAHPPFLADLNRVARLVFGGVVADPRTLEDDDIRPFARDVLLSEERAYPAAILAPTEQGQYLVPPDRLADELLGCAHLYVLARHPTTFRLSDTLGDRRLSCYWGALRVYLPDFSCADRPDDHPLVVGDRLVDPVVRAQLRGMLGVRQHVPMPAGVEAFRAPAAPPRPPATAMPDAAPAADSVPAAPPTLPAQEVLAELRAVTHRLAEVARHLERVIALQESLADQVVGLRTTHAVRGATAAGFERRLARFERWLREHLAPDSPTEGRAAAGTPEEERGEDEGPEITLASVVRQAAVSHSDALLILDEAVRSAEESPYEDVDRAALALDAMALVARRRQSGRLGASLRDAFRELGLDYRGGIADSTPGRLRRQYTARLSGGETESCEEHMVLGSSYDPRYCLRIYFTSRAAVEPRFVIAHVGRHLDVLSTT